MTYARAVLAIASMFAIACGRSVDRAPPAASSSPPRASFTVHEWGLFGLDMAGDQRVLAAAGTRAAGVGRALERVPRGDLGEHVGGLGDFGIQGAGGGKPVIYVHLDEGVAEARFSLALGIAPSSVAETFPGATREATRLVFGPAVASRGACASPSAPPLAGSPACTGTADGFCEAAEIGRYRGDGDVCLRVGESSSELLFYRASDLDPTRLPLVLARQGDGYVVRNPSGAVVDGPVIFIERSIPSGTRYRVLGPSERSGPVPEGQSLADAPTVRAVLLAHALSLGLHEAEADAFIDAWAPAFFDTCHRTGAEAAGPAPPALAPSDVSLLYFAPRALVDAMLPMTIDPPAREVHRAFLVRVVDGTRRLASGVNDGLGPPQSTGLGFSYGSGTPRDTIPVQVDLERPTVRGGLTPDQVRRVVRRNIMQVRFCYEQGVRRNPRLRGSVTMELTIGATGAVGPTRVVRSTLRDHEVDSCIATTARRWTFPAPDPAGEAVARVEFHLVPLDR